MEYKIDRKSWSALAMGLRRADSGGSACAALVGYRAEICVEVERLLEVAEPLLKVINTQNKLLTSEVLTQFVSEVSERGVVGETSCESSVSIVGENAPLSAKTLLKSGAFTYDFSLAEGVSLSPDPDLGEVARLMASGLLRADFRGVASSVFEGNLRMVDRDLLPILSQMLLSAIYGDGKSFMACLRAWDGFTEDPDFYTYKVARFIFEVASGLSVDRVWEGRASRIVAFVAPAEGGCMACYNPFDRARYVDFLLRNGAFLPRVEVDPARCILKIGFDVCINY